MDNKTKLHFIKTNVILPKKNGQVRNLYNKDFEWLVEQTERYIEIKQIFNDLDLTDEEAIQIMGDVFKKMNFIEKVGEVVQKDYREFTVGELLDMGLSVEVLKHNVNSLDDGKEITKIFKGTKQSTKKHQHFTIVKAWKGKFGATVFVTE